MYLAPSVGSAPWNSMVVDGVGTGDGRGMKLVQEIDRIVCGGPTTQVFVGPWTRAGGKSTVLRWHWDGTLMSVDVREEIERGLSAFS